MVETLKDDDSASLATRFENLEHPPQESTQHRLWDSERLESPHAHADKAQRVRRMFDCIAPTYQRVNTLASAGRDRRWRQRTVREAGVQPTDRILDIACGTGDLAVEFSNACPQYVVGLDFARQMLTHAAASTRRGPAWVQGDALRLPFADGSFDITSCAFGIRNFQSLELGLKEMYRVLSPRGRALILEFAMPDHRLLRGLYQFYFARIMPVLATWLSRDNTGAYYYLPRSVATFVSPQEMSSLLKDAGFESVQVVRMTAGIVYLYRADKAADSFNPPSAPTVGDRP